MSVFISPKDVIVDFLRTKLTDPRARAEDTNTEIFDGDATEYNLTAPEGSVQAITSITVDGTDQTKWKDYRIDHQNQKVVFYSPTASGSDNVSISYKQGTTNWIYPDKAKKTLSSTSFPRINIISVGGTGKRLGRYDSDVESINNFQIDIWTKEDQVFTIDEIKYSGEKLGTYIAYEITRALKQNEDDLHPEFYNYTLLSTPRDRGFDSELQCYHKVVEIEVKGINVGEIY